MDTPIRRPLEVDAAASRIASLTAAATRFNPINDADTVTIGRGTVVHSPLSRTVHPIELLLSTTKLTVYSTLIKLPLHTFDRRIGLHPASGSVGVEARLTTAQDWRAIGRYAPSDSTKRAAGEAPIPTTTYVTLLPVADADDERHGTDRTVRMSAVIVRFATLEDAHNLLRCLNLAADPTPQPPRRGKPSASSPQIATSSFRTPVRPRVDDGGAAFLGSGSPSTAATRRILAAEDTWASMRASDAAQDAKTASFLADVADFRKRRDARLHHRHYAAATDAALATTAFAAREAAARERMLREQVWEERLHETLRTVEAALGVHGTDRHHHTDPSALDARREALWRDVTVQWGSLASPNVTEQQQQQQQPLTERRLVSASPEPAVPSTELQTAGQQTQRQQLYKDIRTAIDANPKLEAAVHAEGVAARERLLSQISSILAKDSGAGGGARRSTTGLHNRSPSPPPPPPIGSGSARMKGDWKELVDPATGRPYYLHVLKQYTTWNIYETSLAPPLPPPPPAQPVMTSEVAPAQRVQQLQPEQQPLRAAPIEPPLAAESSVREEAPTTTTATARPQTPDVRPTTPGSSSPSVTSNDSFSNPLAGAMRRVVAFGPGGSNSTTAPAAAPATTTAVPTGGNGGAISPPSALKPRSPAAPNVPAVNDAVESTGQEKAATSTSGPPAAPAVGTVKGDWKAVQHKETGRLYYYNTVTKKTTYKIAETSFAEAPEATTASVPAPTSNVSASLGGDIPKMIGDWKRIYDAAKGKHYYHNKAVGKTQWSAVGTPFEALLGDSAAQPAAGRGEAGGPRAPPAAPAVGTVKGDWKAVKHKETGRLYYYNTVTKKTTYKIAETSFAEAE